LHFYSEDGDGVYCSPECEEKNTTVPASFDMKPAGGMPTKLGDFQPDRVCFQCGKHPQDSVKMYGNPGDYMSFCSPECWDNYQLERGQATKTPEPLIKEVLTKTYNAEGGAPELEYKDPKSGLTAAVVYQLEDMPDFHRDSLLGWAEWLVDHADKMDELIQRIIKTRNIYLKDE